MIRLRFSMGQCEAVEWGTGVEVYGAGWASFRIVCLPWRSFGRRWLVFFIPLEGLS